MTGTESLGMTFTITSEDIRYGRHCDPDCCPIGRALSRAGVDHLGVIGPEVIVSDKRHHARSLPLPPPVRDWILNFDAYQPVEPMSFELRVPGHR